MQAQRHTYPIKIWLIAVLLPVGVTAFLWMLRNQLTSANLSLIYLLAVVWVAIRYSIWGSLITAVTSILLLNYFFLEPKFTFFIADHREVLDLVIFFIIANITGRMAYNERIQAVKIRQGKQIEEAEQLKTSILHAISHDLRTPLTIMKTSISNLLKVPLSPDEQRDTLNAIETEVDELNEMIGNLLDFSRLEAGALQMNLALNSFEEVVGDAVGRIWKRHHNNSVRLEFDHDFPYVPFDYGLLLQALTNLIENSIRYEPSQSFVVIKGTVTDQEAYLAIINHGETIALSEKPHIFKPFYHGKGQRGQVGLGLAIAKGIIDAHGGKLLVSDTIGGGATFTIAIPRKREIRDENSRTG